MGFQSDPSLALRLVLAAFGPFGYFGPLHILYRRALRGLRDLRRGATGGFLLYVKFMTYASVVPRPTKDDRIIFGWYTC